MEHAQHQLDSKKFQESLITWFLECGLDYPWRRTTNPYKILVSELMLQQTRIETVLEKRYFQRWLEKFPDEKTLASADEDEVLKAWEGLGYYNRARNLQKAAQIITTDLGGVFPKSLEELLKLPGVGNYTAGAVLSFAFDRRAPIVDGNVIRVLARIFAYREPVDSSAGKKQIAAWAEFLTPETEARNYNSGIMELGQRICRKSSPRCEQCPVTDQCLSSCDPDAGLIPVKGKSIGITEKTENAILWIREGKVLLTRETGSRRKGLWRLPHLDPGRESEFEKVFEFTYHITRYRVCLRVFSPIDDAEAKWEENESEQWFNLNRKLPALGSPYKKAIEMGNS